MKKLAVKLLFVIFLLSPHNLRASISLISDAETQKFLEKLSNPLIKAAGLSPKHIKIYIVNDSRVNAFVTQGQNIFINTGLITKFNTPDSLIGVMAHEIGHISSGHIARSREEYKKAQNTALVGYVLGIAAIVAGSPEAGQGILIGGTDVAQKSMLKYSRSQEEAADKNALTYLNRVKYPSDGLIRLLESFEMASRGLEGQVNEYMLSHPISKKRIDYLRNSGPKNFSSSGFNKNLQPEMDMILAKLEGFMDDPYDVIKKYKNRNDKYAKYALSVAYFRDSQIKKALKTLNSLIKSSRNNGFFHELKGQILYESGQVTKSIESYKKAVDKIHPRYSIDARLYLSKAVLDVVKSDRELIQYAIDNLLISKRYRPNSPFLYRQLYIAYNKIDNEALAYYNYANYNYLVGDLKSAYRYAQVAKKKFEKSKKTSKGDKLKLEDLIEIVKNDKRFKKTTKK